MDAKGVGAGEKLDDEDVEGDLVNDASDEIEAEDEIVEVGKLVFESLIDDVNEDKIVDVAQFVMDALDV